MRDFFGFVAVDGCQCENSIAKHYQHPLPGGFVPRIPRQTTEFMWVGMLTIVRSKVNLMTLRFVCYPKILEVSEHSHLSVVIIGRGDHRVLRVVGTRIFHAALSSALDI